MVIAALLTLYSAVHVSERLARFPRLIFEMLSRWTSGAAVFANTKVIDMTPQKKHHGMMGVVLAHRSAPK